MQAKALSRSLIKAGEKITQDAIEKAPEDVLDEAERAFMQLRPERGDGFQKLSLLSPVKISDKPREIPTGYGPLDIYLGGLGQGRLITIAARPAIGKTTIALNMAANAAAQGYRVGVFSLEMSTDELMERLIVAESGVDSYRIKQHQLTNDDILNIGKAIYRMSKWHLSIDDTAGISTYELATRAKKEAAGAGLDLLIVDYLQLITPPKAENRVNEVSEITRALKILAKDLRIPVISLSQLSRQVEMRSQGGEPRLADLRDSGSIEQDSDQVVFLWRATADEPTSRIAYTEIGVAKNRHGATGVFTAGLLKEQSKFVVR